jgi:energy-converting hydrogenase B subunit D
MSGISGGVDALVVVALVLVTVAATVAAHTRDPVRQAAVLSGLGLCLALLFLAVQAPDVALSQLAVGSALTPLLILLTVRKVRRTGRGDDTPGGSQGHGGRKEGER